MVIFLFVGFIFLSIAGLILYQKWYFIKNADAQKGLVVAIEQVERKSSRNSGVIYYPIIEYTFNGETYLFKSGGSNIIQHKIGQSVNILSFPDGPEYVMLRKDNSITIAIIFALFSLIGIILYFTQSNSSNEVKVVLTLIAALIPFLIPKYIKYKLKKKGIDSEKVFNIKQSANLITKKELEKSTVLWEQNEVSKVLNKWDKQTFIITMIFLSLSIWGTYYSYTKLNQKQLEIINKLVNNYDYPSYIVEIKNQSNELILFSILFIFSLLMFYSFIYSLRRLNR
jgi:hypothetical protein